MRGAGNRGAKERGGGRMRRINGSAENKIIS